jgi:subtilisin family serine protease
MLVALGLGQAARAAPTEVVVTLDAPSLANAISSSRALTAHARAQRLDVRSPTSVSYLRFLAARQTALAARIERALPAARIRWRYEVVADGMAVVVPAGELGRLASVPGVARVWPSFVYHPLLDKSPELIGADQLWGLPSFSTAGNGMKIGILDEGVDQTHPFFDPSGYAYPPGFPKGDTAYTTPKVIVARAFAPASVTWKYARKPFDPVYSFHGTHVAGIAAGEYSPNAVAGRGPLSGVAPNAYLGNYKIGGIPTEQFGLDANSPEIVAGIEAAVQDGMDVINFSYGEVEIDPANDIVVAAMDAAAQAGVVPAIAAGNDADEWGFGSISSPGSAPGVITAAAASKQKRIAAFSSAGPNPVSLLLKPDVTAPGVSILSSVPAHEGTWAQFSGTSMASPHVAGSAALLKERHPDWTTAQVKSALVLTGQPVLDGNGHEVPTTQEGGGLIYLPLANDPKIFAAPTNFDFGLVRTGKSATQNVQLTDAGGGAGTWTVTVQQLASEPGVEVTAPPAVSVPGLLSLTVSAGAGVAENDLTGFAVLSNGTDTRRIPYWLRVEQPKLEREPHTLLGRPGVYRGDTRGRPALVSSYRYPDRPSSFGFPTDLPGPEQVFRVQLARFAVNFGVVVLAGRVSPRLVYAGNENHLVGYTGLPVDIDPYLRTYGLPEPIVGAVRQGPGSFDFVFDTTSPAAAGPFSFRFWVNDVTPPTLRLLTPWIKPAGNVLVAATDAGSGVDPNAIRGTVDGHNVHTDYSARTGRITIKAGRLVRGRHRLVLQVSDYMEQKNMENTGPLLPNTGTLRATIVVAGG